MWESRVYEEALKDKLYDGIQCIHVPWSSSSESFFSRLEFLKIIERCESRGWGVNGLEVFSDSGQLQDVVFSPVSGDRGATWCRSVLDLYQAPGILFSATFFLSDTTDDPQHVPLADFVEVLERVGQEKSRREGR